MVCTLFCLHAAMVTLQVDKHIRRLDGDLARFEAEIHFKETAGRRASMSGVCVCVCVCACVHACVRVCVLHKRVHVGVWVLCCICIHMFSCH